MQTNLGYAAPYVTPPKRCAIYARYSSNQQDPCSIPDQIRECREAIEAKGWVVVEDWVCSDEAVSGQSLLNRTGLERLLKHAQNSEKEFDTIVMDDTSRFGRNLSDSLPITDHLKFDRVELYFVKSRLASWEPHFRDNFIREQRSDEEYSVGLGEKVKRGQKGRVDRGFVGSGRTFGYTNVPVEVPGTRGTHGRPRVEGVLMEINPDESLVVKRIFEARRVGTLGHLVNWCQRDTQVKALERHYKAVEIAELWGMSVKLVRTLFIAEPGVLKIDRPEQRNKRGYCSLYIPESVAPSVHRRLSN